MLQKIFIWTFFSAENEPERIGQSSVLKPSSDLDVFGHQIGYFSEDEEELSLGKKKFSLHHFQFHACYDFMLNACSLRNCLMFMADTFALSKNQPAKEQNGNFMKIQRAEIANKKVPYYWVKEKLILSPPWHPWRRLPFGSQPCTCVPCQHNKFENCLKALPVLSFAWDFSDSFGRFTRVFNYMLAPPSMPDVKMLPMPKVLKSHDFKLGCCVACLRH